MAAPRPKTQCSQTRCSQAAAARTQVLRAGPTSAAHTGRLTNLMATDADRIGKAESITWLLSQAAVARRAAMVRTTHWYDGAYRHGQWEAGRRRVSRGKPLLSRGDSDSPPPRLSQWSFSVLTLPLVIYMMARELGPSV